MANIGTKLHKLAVLVALISLSAMSFGVPGVPIAEASLSSGPVRIIVSTRGGSDGLERDYPIRDFKPLLPGLPEADGLFVGITDSSVLARLKTDSRVEYAEADGSVAASSISVQALTTADDPFFTTDSSQEDKQWYLPKIKLPDAWGYGTGSNSVTVAIVDTGIHAQHIELNDGRVVEGYNVLSGQTIPANSSSDDNGHGTAVAGVIGAIPNNGKGIAGVDWHVNLMPVKALEADGTGVVSSVAAAILWAADHGADIINLSLGGQSFGNDLTLNNAIVYAHNKGAVIVAAGGNDSADNGLNLDTNPVYPVCSDAGSNLIIGVAATDFQDKKAAFSNFGINCIDISAPGKKILTTAFLPSDPSNNVLIYGSGTSLAAPIVSGVAALLKSNNPGLTNDDIRNIILKTADNIDALNQTNCLGSSCNGFLGKGRINALSALSPQPLLDGSLVREAETGKTYLISGGVKRYVSNFVFNQRGFSQDSVAAETNGQLANYQFGQALPPLNGTLIKGQLDPIVYVIDNGVKRPLTYYIFVSRGFRFSDVKTLPEPDVNVIETGEWYWPPDGTMVLIKDNPTVYVMDQSVRRPVTYFVFTQRKLSFARVIRVTTDEFSHLPVPPDAYWLPPLDGTLVKSANNPTVYLLQNGRRSAVSYEAFVARNLRFGSIVTIPQAELDVIEPGPEIAR
ncbi:MAG: S8 family serine peptidase [Candidatus Saccharibacteria bacterium]